MPRPKEYDREAVLLDAMTVFRDQGYQVTSVQDLVERMALNRFSLYAAFGSKHDLFVEALEAYYERIAIPFFGRLEDSGEGLAIIEKVLLGLVVRIKGGESPNGCLLCNSIAEVGARADSRADRVFEKYLERVEAGFRAAIERASELGEVPPDIDAEGWAKMLVAYSTGLLSVAKVLSEKELRQSVRATVGAIK
jgi:TetR/AcrR family transcriptional repressor of nem operon